MENIKGERPFLRNPETVTSAFVVSKTVGFLFNA